MLTDAIKQSESYQMFIKYSTSQIPPNKRRGKCSKGKKTVDESQETVDVLEESEPEPEPARKKTVSRRLVKKKVTISATDNIIPDPDAALELAKSINQTKAEEAEAARKFHATHARITKLKGASSLTLEEQEDADIMQTLKESKKTSKRQPGTGGSNKGTGSKPRVPNESTIVSATSSEGTGIKPGVPDEEKDITEEKAILEWVDEQESEYSDDDNDDVENDDKDSDADDEGDDHISDTQDADDEDFKTESDEDDIYNDEEITDTAKADAKKISEVKDDAEKTKLSLSSSSLSVSSSFGDQFLKLSSDSFLISIVKDTIDMEINSLLEVKIQSEESPSTATSITLPPPSVSTTPSVPQQTTTSIPTQPITIDAPTITNVVPESNALTAVELRVAKLEKDVSELKTVDHSTEALAILKSQVPSVQLPELPKKQTPTVDLKQGFEKSASEILKIKREQAEKQQMPKFTIKSTDKADLKEYDLKSAPYQSMHANKSFNRNPANHRLYHVLMEALIEDENAMDKGVNDTVKDHKINHDDDEDPPAGLNEGKKTKSRRTKESESSKKPSSTKETSKGKAPTKGSKTGKSASTKEPVEEPIPEVIMNDAGDDVAHDDNQPQDTSEPKTRNTQNPDWFKQPPRPLTLDLERNKRQVVLDQPAQPLFNQMVSATKDPITFNNLMATPIDFSKYVLNGLKIENLTQDILLGHAFNLLKGTCSSSIELEYNFQECLNALIDKISWNNPEEDRYLFDLSNHLPLQGPLGHRTIAADYFFNNDLEYLKTSDPEVTYTSSITKTKVARYEIKGIKDMVVGSLFLNETLIYCQLCGI
ncbi:hypothetical protein Tco_0543049 [Tanacetum coccineum]